MYASGFGFGGSRNGCLVVLRCKFGASGLPVSKLRAVTVQNSSRPALSRGVQAVAPDFGVSLGTKNNKQGLLDRNPKKALKEP